MAKKKSGNVVGEHDYGTIKVPGADGKTRHSVSNGDAVAKAMLLHLAKGGTVKQVADANDIKIGGDKSRNAGLIRMAVGAQLRGLVRNGTAVKIGSVKVSSLKQAVELPKVEKQVRAAKKAVSKKAKRKAAPRAKTETPQPEAAQAA